MLARLAISQKQIVFRIFGIFLGLINETWQEFIMRPMLSFWPSREEGFGMVLSQALACGLPIVCTIDTGGPDLRHTPALSERIVITDSNDLESLQAGMREMIDRLQNDSFPPLSNDDRETLTWAAYAERYEHNIRSMLSDSN